MSESRIGRAERRGGRSVSSAKIATLFATFAVCVGRAPVVRAANHDPIQLSWVVPEQRGCPDREEIFEKMRRYIGSDVTQDHTPIAAVATIRPLPRGELELVLKTYDGTAHGERVFRDRSCRSIADAAVVVLAWMVDPEGMAARSTESTPAEPPLTRPSAQPVRRQAASAPKSSSVQSQAYVGAGIGADEGTLPRLAMDSQLRLGLLMQHLRIEVYGKYWSRVRQTLTPVASGMVPGASFTLWGVGVQGCLERLPARAASQLGLALCVGPELDILHGAGFGVTVPAEASKAWVAITAGVEGRVHLLGPLHLLLSLGAALPTRRERFALRGVGELYRPSQVAARAEIGGELEF